MFGKIPEQRRRWGVGALLGAGALAISFLTGVTPASAIVGGAPADPAFFPTSLLFPAGRSVSALAR